MRKYFLAIIFIFIGLPLLANRQEFSAANFDVESWIESNFNSSVIPPFSFCLGNRHSDTFIKRWEFSSSSMSPSQEGEVSYRFSWTGNSGMKVTADVKGYPEYNAVEWVLHFMNMSDSDSETLKDVKSLDVSYSYREKGSCDLFYSYGSHVSRSDFQPRNMLMSPGVSHHMEPVGGRSSNVAFPFFDIIGPSGHDGVITAIGWTGNWSADISSPRQHSLSVSCGMKNLELYLKPGETIRTPSSCLLFWNGENKMTGHNMFRRFMVRIQAPKVNGNPAVYPVSTGFNWSDPYPCNEYSCLNETTALAYIQRYCDYGLNPEVFWLDAGWYEKCDEYYNNKNWANTVGNWITDAERFPRGLKPVSDAVHEAGAKFMLWFEPERVIKESLWGRTMRGYMLDRKDSCDAYLFDLTNPDAVEWLADYICEFMKENGVDYYRQDFNTEPEPYWADNDEPGRKGICEIRYIEGLYRFWDLMLERMPEAIIDNCASGGRRLDFETFKRSAPMWRTDYDYGEPIGYQTHTYGLSFYLPLSGTGATYPDKFSFRSSLGTSVVFSWKISEPGNNLFDMQRDFAEFFEVRPYFYEDFYPLTEYEDMTPDTIWLAYQLHRPSDDTGFIVAFRRDNAKSDSINVRLGGLEDTSVYQFTDCDTGEQFSADGASLKKGMKLSIKNKRESKLLKYRMIN